MANLLELKNGTLKAKAIELNFDLTGVTKTKNPPIREAFRNHFGREKANGKIKVEGSLTTENNLNTLQENVKKNKPTQHVWEKKNKELEKSLNKDSK